MKKISTIIFLLLIVIFSFVPKSFAENIFKITSANFDTSNSMIVLTAQDTVEAPIMQDVKIIKMENPNRAYFDINDAVITIPKQDWTFTSGPIKQVKINQFSTNPNSVRVVMYFDDDFNPDNIKLSRLKNNIFIKLNKNNSCNENYLQNTYRDEHSSSSDFYEYTTVMVPVEPAQNDIVGQIQDAFNTTTEAVQNNIQKKELKLNTKYYLNNITPKNNSVLLSGFGAITLERPYILSNPTRIVYDLPNTLTDSKIRNKEYKLNETDTVKVGQFSVNKARIVISSENANDYIPVYSNDNQSLLFANMKKVNYQTLLNNSANIIGYSKEKNDSQTYSMVLFFDAPMIHAIDRDNNKFDIYLYNTSKYSEDRLKTTFTGTPFEKMQPIILPKIGLKLSIPLEQDSMVSTYLGADGKTFKVKIKEPQKKPAIAAILPTPVVKNTPEPVGSGHKKVVIDAGHGGSDAGAIGGGIYEKNITLDVAKRVEKLLTKKGYTVQMTRDNDTYVSLQDRVAISENFNPDIFVSIHVNSSVRPEITGIETHYYHQESMSLAQTVHSSFASAIKSPNRGLFKSKFYVINHTTAPSILVEIGFISNSSERAELVSEKRKQATAKAIADGIQNYFKQYDK